MKKIIAGILTLATVVLVSSCSLTGEREDAIQLEGMMPKEDNATIDAMMKKTDENNDTEKNEESDAMMTR